MHFKILFCLFASSLAFPNLSGYNLPSPVNGGGLNIGPGNGFRNTDTGSSNGGSLGGLNVGPDNGFRNTDFGSSNGGNFDVSFHGGSASLCGDGQALNSDGSCAEAQVSRKIFVFQAPEQNFERQNNQPIAHKPKLNYNIVFVRTPEGAEGYEPVVVPPAQQKTLVYVLNKHEDYNGPQVIETPDSHAHAPEVFYINYKEGDNPQLPIGVDLQTALASAITEQGQLLIGGGGAGSINLSGYFGSSSAGGFENTVSGGSNSFVTGENGGFGNGIGNFRGQVSGGSISVGNGGINGFASDRGISGQFAPPTPPGVYGTPFRN